MIFIDELKNLTLYKKPFYIPIDEDNKRVGSAVLLLTPNYESSKNVMNMDYIKNNNLFVSYYMEKNINYYITSESVISDDPGEKYTHIYEPFEEATKSEYLPQMESATAIIKNNKGEIYLQYHKKLNAWTFPGGKIELGEEPEEALVREIKEETGIDCKKISKYFVHKFSCNYDHKDVMCTDHLFIVHDYKGTPKIIERNKATESGWYTLEQARALKNKSIIFQHFIDTVSTKNNKMKYSKKYQGIKYVGYKHSVDDIRNLVNGGALRERCNSIGITYKPYPLIINCVDTIKDYETSRDNSSYMTIMTKDCFDANIDGDYFLSVSSDIYKNIIQNYFPKASIELVSAYAEYKSGLYKDLEKDPIYDLSCYANSLIFKAIDDDMGKREVLRILKDNDIRSFVRYGIRYKVKAGVDDYKSFITEESSEVDSLVRRIKYHSKRSSKYKTNKIERIVHRTVSPDEVMPEMKDKDGNTVGEYVGPSGTAASVPPEPVKVEATGMHKDLLKNGLMISENYSMMLEDINYDMTYRKLLYNDRIKYDKDVLLMYKKVKAENPFIKNAYININRYYNKNLFVDLSYYSQTFFTHNSFNADKSEKLYFELMKRLIMNSKINDAGYTKKTVFVPIMDWYTISPKGSKLWMYRETINPISVITRALKRTPHQLAELFGDIDFVFLSNDMKYFKINFTMPGIEKKSRIFSNLIRKIVYSSADIVDEDDKPDIESAKAITMNITDKLEDKGVKINKLNLVGKGEPVVIKVSKDAGGKSDLDKKKEDLTKINAVVKNNTKTAPPKKIDTVKNKSDPDKKKETLTKINAVVKNNTKTAPPKKIDTVKSKSDLDKKKEDLTKAIKDVADKSDSTDDALDKLDNDRIKKLIEDLMSEEDDAVNINAARTSRIAKLDNDLLNKNIQGRTIRDILAASEKENEVLPATALNIDTIEEDWKGLKYVNFDKSYDIDADIARILQSMKDWSKPISVVSIDVKDNSTNQDALNLYTIQLEDYTGKRFTIKFDVPTILENKYLLLRGNRKTINIQSFLMPVLKTDEDSAQLVSNYNKIFVRRFGTSSGKSIVSADLLAKALNKYKGTDITITTGDNTRICSKYELPIDYIDLSSIFSKVETKTHDIYFNQDEIRSKYEIDDTKGVPIAVTKSDKSIIYYNGEVFKLDNNSILCSSLIVSLVTDSSQDFSELYHSMKKTTRYTYSKASILSTEIPIVILCGYAEGLIKTMDKSGVKYTLEEKITSIDKNSDIYDYIKFSDGYLKYEVTYDSSLLMNGLKECNTEAYSLGDINSKTMFLDILDDFGGRIKADGLDNFKDCMIDPITKDVCEYYKVPTDYHSLLLYSNHLLVDNKFIKHTKTEGRRMRRAELVAGYVYKVITDAYSKYSYQIKHSRSNPGFVVKQSAVVDLLLSDPTCTDKSIINAINDVEDSNAVSTKGLSGMNSERSYDLDKRTFDKSMTNVLGMSTGFAGNVGITRQSTIDMNIEGGRGYIKSGENEKHLSAPKTLTMTEAQTPYGVTSDDPFRTAMTFIQTAKHGVRTVESDPVLVTYGADEALPYLSSDIFAFKAKNKGKVIEKTDEYMIVQYADDRKDFIQLSPTIEKNSDGGFYVNLQLITDLKVNSTFKEGDILAYDKDSFTDEVGENDNLAYKLGKLSKVAILNTDEGFEDSAIITGKLAKEMGSYIIVAKELRLPASTNIYNMVKVGDKVEEGDNLLVFQNPYDQDDVNTLLKNLVGDEEEISDLGRIPVRSKITGEVAGIEILRTADIENLSPSLKSAVRKYEAPINSMRSTLKKHGIDDKTLLASTDKLNQSGRLKNVEDGVMIIFYLGYLDVMAVGDKMVYYSANKGTVKYIIPEGQEPTTSSRPNEPVDAFITVSSLNGRMVCSTPKVGALTRLMIELDRTCKDMAKIPYDDSKI